LTITALNAFRHLLVLALLFILMIWIVNCCVYLIDKEYEDAIDMKNQTRAIRTYQMLIMSLNEVRSAQATVGLVLIGGMAVGLTMLFCMT